jgi:hypothetical protein
MTPFALTALALALAAPPEPASEAARSAPQPAAQAPEPTATTAPKAQAGTPAPALVKEGAPVLAQDRMSRCFEREGGGRWRAQCDATTKTCLVAPDAELSRDGEPRAGLDRAPPCASPGWREQDLVPQGYTIVPALAETPPGWRRDERQRIMQVNFDLARRIWLGAGFAAGNVPWASAGEATAGVRWDIPFRLGGAPALGRLRALETYAIFDGNFVDFTAAGFDASRAYPSPLLRITTFIGKPRRFDPPLYLGGWVEAVRVETVHASSGTWFDRTEIGAAALTLDLWRSHDLASFFRLRGGAGYEVADQLDGGAWVPHAAVDADLTLDRGGFHHVRATALAEWLAAGSSEYQPKDAARPRLPASRSRLTGKAEYEIILLAVNDQPISAVLDARVQKRNDVPDLPTSWIYQTTASLRFNLWAPPRRDAPAQERL